MSATLRKYLLITLSHAEREERQYYNQKLIVGKLRTLFNCQAIAVAREGHKSKGYHYHAGVLNDSASRYTATKAVREAFPEFEGRQLNVSFHKSWNTVCAYVLKQDPEPHCWNTTAKECKDRAVKQKQGKRNVDSLSLLRNCSTWEEVLGHPRLASQAMRSYNSVKQVWIDLRGAVPWPSLQERLREYLAGRSQYLRREIHPYSQGELRDRAKALEWLGANLDTEREHRKPQLLILGEPMTGKSWFVKQMQEFLRLYYLPMRSGDFSEATTNVDMWVIDEFTSKRMPEHILNAVLDGQSVGLDSKYGQVFYKNKNIPVVMITNAYPDFSSSVQYKAFATRVNVVEFIKGEPFETERVAKTLLEYLDSRDSKQLEGCQIALTTQE